MTTNNHGSCIAERRFDAYAFGGIDGAPFQAIVAHRRCGHGGRLILAHVRIEMQNTACQCIILNARAFAQCLQTISTVTGQTDDRTHIVARAIGRALTQELQTPAEQFWIQTPAKQQGRILFAHPAEKFA